MKKLLLVLSLQALFLTQIGFASTLELKVQQRFLSALDLINEGQEKKGIKEIKVLAITQPKSLRNIYQHMFLNPIYSKYTDILKQGYNRLLDIMIIKSLAHTTKTIDKYMQDTILTYAFFSSKKEFISYLKPLIVDLDRLMEINKNNDTKDNQEILALIKANYLLGVNKDEEAYKVLKQNQPYHSKALQAMSYFSAIKDIPLFKNREKLLQAINFKGFKLRAEQFTHEPKFLFDYYWNKVLIKR